MTNNDRTDLKINETDEEIDDMTKYMWNKYVKDIGKFVVLESILEYNNTK